MSRLAIAALLLTSVCFAQNKPKEPDKPKDPPAITQESRNAIRDNQYEQSKVQEQLTRAKDFYLTQQTQLNNLRSALENAKIDAVKAVKLDPADWDLDVDRLVFVAKPKPPITAKKP